MTRQNFSGHEDKNIRFDQKFLIKPSPHFSIINLHRPDKRSIRREYPTKFELEQHESALNSEITVYICIYIILADTHAKSPLVYTALCAAIDVGAARHPRKRAEAKEVCRSLYVTASNSAFGTRGLEASLVPSVYICTGSRGFCVSVSEVTYAAATWQCGRSRPIDASRCLGARLSRSTNFTCRDLTRRTASLNFIYCSPARICEKSAWRGGRK